MFFLQVEELETLKKQLEDAGKEIETLKSQTTKLKNEKGKKFPEFVDNF